MISPEEMIIMGASPDAASLSYEELVAREERNLERRRRANLDCSMEGVSPWLARSALHCTEVAQPKETE